MDKGKETYWSHNCDIIRKWSNFLQRCNVDLVNTGAASTLGPLLQVAFAGKIPIKHNSLGFAAMKLMYPPSMKIHQWYILLMEFQTYLVPRLSFDRRKLEFGVIWIHALNFLSGWCTQYLIHNNPIKIGVLTECINNC